MSYRTTRFARWMHSHFALYRWLNLKVFVLWEAFKAGGFDEPDLTLFWTDGHGISVTDDTWWHGPGWYYDVEPGKTEPQGPYPNKDFAALMLAIVLQAEKEAKIDADEETT